MTTTPVLGATDLVAAQAIPETTVNENVRRFEQGAQFFNVLDKDLATPPGGTPADGAAYIVAGSPTGAWAGKAGNVVFWQTGTGWRFIAPRTGFFAWVQDESALYTYGGGAWGAYSSTASVEALSWKQAVRVATTAAITLASGLENGDTIDGVTLATGDRVLVKNQSSASENGIYVVPASGAPTRASDANAGAELVNATVVVSEGSTQADTIWICTTNAPITPDSTALTFAQLGGTAGQLLAANNLSDLGDPAAARTNLGADVYLIGLYATTAPAASEVLALHIVTDAFTFPVNFGSPNSRGAVGTNPAGSFVLDVQRQVNATGAFSSIGTITISTGGAFTFATTGGTAKSIAVNDVIRVVAPGTPDAAIANLTVTLRGARN